MCGICGVLGTIALKDFEQMLKSMYHRGPDDHGIFVENDVSLGMTRLSILDVSGKGHQPMANDEGSVWIVYNGETYNFREERALLEGKGYSFRSSSDTEVILRMYEEYGDDLLCRMRGMFALAIYDKRAGPGRERLLLARDHLGIKPLLYAHTSSHFVFASEMKAVLASGLVQRKPDPESLRLLLTYGSITQPRTAVEGVRMLLPGHRMIIESGSVTVEQFWKIDPHTESTVVGESYKALTDRVRETLETSVRLQMVSDVPIGAFLSGGVDSSLLVALMAKQSGSQVKTFSVGFEQEGSLIDETDDADRIARYIGTDHTRVIVTGSDVRERICHIASSLDQPSLDGVNSYFVSLAASRAVTVAISGTGGDELFAGYPWFIEAVREYHRGMRHPLFTKIRRFVGMIAQNRLFNPLVGCWMGMPVDLLRKQGSFLSMYFRCYTALGPRRAARLLSPKFRQSAHIGQEPQHDLLSADELPGGSPIQRVSALCLRGYTQNQLLRDIDAVSMAHSLEVRVPFLDPELVDLALSLPDDAKLGDCAEIPSPTEQSYCVTGAKRILIDAGRDLLPEGLDKQVKRGFAMPFEVWLKGPLRDILEDTLSEDVVRSRGLFDVGEVTRLKSRFFRGKEVWVGPWLLMIVELWCREVLDANPGEIHLHMGKT